MSSQPATCANCGATLVPASAYCENCGTPVPGTIAASQPAADMAILTGFESAPPAKVHAGSDPLLEFDVDYPESLSRWKIFVKWLLAIPHWIILSIFGFAVGIVWFIAFFAILITGKFPRGLWDFMLMYMRWTANVTAYSALLQRDEYPPFGDATYPVRLNLDYPQSLSRWLIFVKWLLIIPHWVILGILGIAMLCCVAIAFFAILITGRYPRSLFDFVVGVSRWGNRVSAYTYFMTDRYPPFSLD